MEMPLLFKKPFCGLAATTGLYEMPPDFNQIGGIESRERLQEMFESHQPSAWYLGHFHINREFLIGGTKFRCLAGMASCPMRRLSVKTASEGEHLSAANCRTRKSLGAFQTSETRRVRCVFEG